MMMNNVLKPSTISKVFEIFKQNNPYPTTELVYATSFECLVSVVLSAQATDIGVNKATLHLFKVANTPEKILNLGEDGLITYIKSIGLYKTKAKNIMQLCRVLVEKYNSQIPEDFTSLTSLAGVGRKTANVVLNTLFGHNTIAVDTHVFRVSNRLGITYGDTVLEVEKQLMTNIPKKYQQDAHHWLILHGRYVCKARKPLCSICSVNKYCKFYVCDQDWRIS
jgi:endonuclease-3